MTGDWSSAFNNLDNAGMKRYVLNDIINYTPYDMTGYYKQVTVNYNDSCTGYYDQWGNYQYWCNCWNTTCTYYSQVNNENYDGNYTYFQLVNNNMTQVDPASLNIQILSQTRNPLKDNSMAGFYRKVKIVSNASYAGYYDADGNYLSSGICTTSGGCYYYELIKYKNSSGNIEKYNDSDEYYYLVTRDTNIIVLKTNATSTWSQTKPFTLTDTWNGTDYRNSYYFNVQNLTIKAYADTTIENIKIYSTRSRVSSDTTPSSSTSGSSLYNYVLGNWHNLKLGRGITQNGNYVNFHFFIGGNNGATGSSSNITKYRLIVESGVYNGGSLCTAGTSTLYNDYVEARAIYGNDYDRVNNDNTNFILMASLSATWGANTYASSSTAIAIDSTYKSGSIGYAKHDNLSGTYIGGRQYGYHYAAERGIIEGGYIYTVTGGPISNSGRSSLNDLYLYIKGGEMNTVFAGAGVTATYGNRIVQMTDGIIDNSLLGGSLAASGRNGQGTVNGTSYLYIGGDAQIGTANNISSNYTVYNVESGSVFGNGNGHSGYSSVGSNDNAIVIINDNANILQNVYGGGNFGATGVNSSSNTTYTDIKILGGTVNGNVYGGGNRNGSGSSSKTSTITIDMTAGTVKGSIFGGSRTLGTVYGSTNININGGVVATDIYGGGEGGYANSSNPGTFVSENTNINIGNNTSSPDISGDVYGGSAYGTVNAISKNDSSNNNQVNVTLNNGTVTGSIYGGAKGSSSYTPDIKGNIIVNINGGTVTNVFGGCNAAGIPEGSDNIYLKGGVVGSVYGGGNNTGINESNVYLKGSTVTAIYGGSNQSGTATTTNITTTSGQVNDIFGGNNLGGNAVTTNVNINGGTIINDIYGGGNEAAATTTNVILNNANNTLVNVYGGGKSADASTTNVTENGVATNNIFGGSNTSGTVNDSNVTIASGTVTSVYGGNNAGGLTDVSHVTINNGTITNLFGGGDQAITNTTNVTVNNGTISDSFGGGNEAEATTTNYVINGGTLTNAYGSGNNAGSTTTNINAYGGTVTNLYGGANVSGDVTTSNVITDSTGTIPTGVNITCTPTAQAVTYESTEYKTVVTLDCKANNTTSSAVSKWSGVINVPNSILYSNYSNSKIAANNGLYYVSEVNQYYGTNSIAANSSYSFQFKVLTNTAVSSVTAETKMVKPSNLIITDVYGGNNAGGLTTNTNLTINAGLITNIYGGGNQASVGNTNVLITDGTIGTVYGGGNAAAVNTDTILKITGGLFASNIYGGGNEGTVNQNTNVNMNAGKINGSIYAGGNGSTAIVNGNTNINVSGSSIIGYTGGKAPDTGSVFGGGNAAATGSSNVNTSQANVNIYGGTIYGNVYGGANTSVVYGTTLLNIGDDITASSDVIRSDLKIGGTVFGGGEANAAGSESYDYSFISVTSGITVNINGNNYQTFAITGSIFGSGDASSTTGTSNINIKNYGTYSSPKKNISIQRTNLLNIDNSNIILTGATDRTNEYSNVLFTLSIIDELDLKNNSNLFLETGANLLKCFKSLTSANALETVTIDDTNQTVTKNVNNGVYMLQGKNLNIATNESVTSYGEVYGMAFLGMYSYKADGSVNKLIYDQSFNYGSTLDWGDMPTKGSYVLGLHKANHDINVDGFYSNFMDEATTTNKPAIIVPKPDDSNFYMWTIGDVVTEYNIDLTASKYATLGAVELPFLDFAKANTTFSILGFDDSSLAEGVTLTDEANIPRVASSTDVADKTMALVMKSGNKGWLTNGSTTFRTDSATKVNGTKTYVGENSTDVPSLLFYLYHSKNLGTADNMGTVTISVLASTKIDDLTKENKRLVINVNLSRALYNTNDYEGAITAGRQYSMFATTTTNITSKSAISAYFSLYNETENIYKNGYHRALVSSYNLPLNTKITMIDLSGTQPKYYYHVINSTDVTSATTQLQTDNTCAYNLSEFEVMGALNSGVKYDDATMNTQYYHDGKSSEEFIFIVDFADTNINADSMSNSLLMELRNNEEQTITSVLGIEHAQMVYNLYANKDATIDVSGSLDKSKIYSGDIATLDLSTTYTQTKVGSDTVYDTKYFDSKLGIKISLIDNNNNVVTGTSLLGLYYVIDGVEYHPSIDGTTRIKLADRVGNTQNWIKIYTNNANLATGQYKVKVEAYGSPDGIYYGLTAAGSKDFPLYIVNEIYGLDITTDDNSLIIYHDTGFTLNKTNHITYNINYNSGLTNPHLDMKLYRRKYDTIYDTNYELVDLHNYVTNALISTSTTNEYLVVDNPNTSTTLGLDFKDNLQTGTYKMEFILYDGDSVIGSIIKYMIIK
jgi:hypothetical protein